MKKYAQLRVDLLADARFRSLSEAAQRLYLILLATPSMSYCGVADYRPTRLAGYSSTSTPESVMEATAELSANYYVVVDDEYEEILIRSHIKYDGVMQQPRLAVAMANAYAAVMSPVIRSVIVFELLELRESTSGLGAWEKPDVQALLSHEATDVRDLAPYFPSIRATFGGNVEQRLGEPQPPPITTTVTSPSNVQLATSPNEIRDDVRSLCNLLADLIEGNGSIRPTIGKSWIDAARLMLDKDKRDLRRAEYLMRWCQADEFWRANILSMGKFREKFDQLRLAADKAGVRVPAGAGQTSPNGDSDRSRYCEHDYLSTECMYCGGI